MVCKGLDTREHSSHARMHAVDYRCLAIVHLYFTFKVFTHFFKDLWWFTYRKDGDDKVLHGGFFRISHHLVIGQGKTSNTSSDLETLSRVSSCEEKFLGSISPWGSARWGSSCPRRRGCIIYEAQPRFTPWEGMGLYRWSRPRRRWHRGSKVASSQRDFLILVGHKCLCMRANTSHDDKRRYGNENINQYKPVK